jgi:two-component system phosphate regulon sensor histidine kinase PhoR
MNRRRLSIGLMLLTIGVIAAFQVYWLQKNYAEEKKVFTIHTNNLFQETVFRLQLTKLHLDTGTDAHIRNKPGIIKMINIMRKDLGNVTFRPDTDRPTEARVNLSFRGMSNGKDSTREFIYSTAGARVVEFLQGVDSLQGIMTPGEISIQYGKALAEENIRAPFHIKTLPASLPSPTFTTTLPRPAIPGIAPPMFTTDSNLPFRKVALAVPRGPSRNFFPDSLGNRVTLGFSHPVTYQLDFDNTFWFLCRRIAPQALFSLLLVGLTVLSFWWLYRNWQQQRRLIALKNDFIGNMTHELKTPIATVSVAVEALQHFNALQDPLRTKEYLDISAGELQRLSLLVDKVLKLSLFEKEEIELKNDTFDLKTLVEEVADSMRLQFEKLRARLHLGAEGADFSLRADKLHITSVIFNLLDNALKYSRTNPDIRVDVVAEPQALVLSVTDNGRGIPAAYQRKIFEKFFRVPTGDHHNVKGYGLGLSYVSYVLQRQGGRISVESEEGAGSRFTVHIPRNHLPLTQPAGHA